MMRSRDSKHLKQWWKYRESKREWTAKIKEIFKALKIQR
jgi:hypothetical protein